MHDCFYEFESLRNEITNRRIFGKRVSSHDRKVHLFVLITAYPLKRNLKKKSCAHKGLCTVELI